MIRRLVLKRKSGKQALAAAAVFGAEACSRHKVHLMLGAPVSILPLNIISPIVLKLLSEAGKVPVMLVCDMIRYWMRGFMAVVCPHCGSVPWMPSLS